MDKTGLIDRIDSLLESIYFEMDSHLDSSSCFAERDFYGLSFFFSLKALKTNTIDSNLSYQLACYDQGKRFHYEFNRYALQHVLSNEDTQSILRGKKYTNTRVANWRLLRAHCYLREGGIKKAFAFYELLIVRLWNTRHFAIEDRRSDYTSQYNYFSLALINELPNFISKLFWSKKWMLNAVNRCLCQVERSGIANVLGRGALQSFGYSSLIYLLSFYANDKKNLNAIGRLLSVLEKQVYQNQFLPLVLNKKISEERFYRDKPNLKNKKFLGWYGYNNIRDYQAFSGLLMYKTLENLASSDVLAKNSSLLESTNNELLPIAKDIWKYEKKGISLYVANSQFEKSFLSLYSPIAINDGKFICPPVVGEKSFENPLTPPEYCLPKLYVMNQQLKLRHKHFTVNDEWVEFSFNYNFGVSVKRRIFIKGKSVVIEDSVRSTRFDVSGRIGQFFSTPSAYIRVLNSDKAIGSSEAFSIVGPAQFNFCDFSNVKKYSVEIQAHVE